MPSEFRTLKDVATGRSAVQGTADGVRVTVITEPHPLRERLAGRALVLLSPGEAFVDDDTWEPIVGGALALDGGTLLRVREVDLGRALEGADPEDPVPDLLVPLTVCDPYFPPVDVLVPWARLSANANVVGPDDGPRVRAERVPCRHRYADPPVDLSCRFCFWRWWATRAKAAGLTFSTRGAR